MIKSLSSTLTASAFYVIAAAAHASEASPNNQSDYVNRPEVKAMIDELAEEGLDRQRITSLMSQAKRQDKILEAIARPAEKTLTWAQYQKIFIQQSRMDQGNAFRKEQEAILAKAESVSGVDRDMILAIIGIETRYGRQRGGYKVIDALATLGFDYPPRSTFFRGQLKELFRLEQSAHIDAATITGSYAGAMGYPQFIPSSYINFAVDFDEDGKTDLVDNPVDAIGSVANYFKEHKWQTGLPVAARARVEGDKYQALVNDKGKPDMTLKQAIKAGITPVPCKESEHCFDKLVKDTDVALLELEGERGKEYWLVTQNFYVITRYNHSVLYAMAAYQLSREFEKTNPDKKHK
ncbi:MAG: lytic murein transglycosylase B [Alcanivoracaceae bacterium]|nr:lytic murein transglycosylase B [Alcanivoracaceae bacterium]